MNDLIYNKKGWIEETDPLRLKDLMKDFLVKSDYHILNMVEHYFKPQGYTAVWLLAESHLAIHTFPEENKTYIELSSCNNIKYNKFIELVSKLLIDE